MALGEITTKPYRIGAACERCVFGTGEHTAWCRRLHTPNHPQPAQEAYGVAVGAANPSLPESNFIVKNEV